MRATDDDMYTPGTLPHQDSAAYIFDGTSPAHTRTRAHAQVRAQGRRVAVAVARLAGD